MENRGSIVEVLVRTGKIQEVGGEGIWKRNLVEALVFERKAKM